MSSLSNKDKRTGIRIPLLSEKVDLFVNGEHHDADIGDITIDGIFLKTANILPPKTKIHLVFKLPGDLGNLAVDAEVVRVNWTVNRKRGKESLGFGAQFSEMSAGTKKILDAYVVYLRNKQIISVSKRIIEEFFGPKGPKKV